MKVAFHAPLKSPDHPVPSGDRQLARALLQALRAGGHDVSVASRFRSFDGGGNGARQARLAELGARIAQRLVARYRRTPDRPDVWFTYHVYHKAPDWLGPSVTRALGIPYVLAEASIADKRRDGAWALGHAAALAAVRSADAVICLNPADVAGIRHVRGNIDTTDVMPPFLDVDAFRECAVPAPRPPGRHARVQMIAVAMMRHGAKLGSYRVLAAALARVRYTAWELTIVGDGPARSEVEAAFAGLGADRVHFAGAMPSAEVAAQLGQADLFVWPAVDEAFGMAFIEAQACGLSVVGGNAGGVAAVVDDGRTGLLVATGDADAFAAATERMLRDGPQRLQMGREALAYVRSRHDLPAAAARLDAVLRRVAAARAANALAAVAT